MLARQKRKQSILLFIWSIMASRIGACNSDVGQVVDSETRRLFKGMTNEDVICLTVEGMEFNGSVEVSDRNLIGQFLRSLQSAHRPELDRLLDADTVSVTVKSRKGKQQKISVPFYLDYHRGSSLGQSFRDCVDKLGEIQAQNVQRISRDKTVRLSAIYLMNAPVIELSPTDWSLAPTGNTNGSLQKITNEEEMSRFVEALSKVEANAFAYTSPKVKTRPVVRLSFANGSEHWIGLFLAPKIQGDEIPLPPYLWERYPILRGNWSN